MIKFLNFLYEVSKIGGIFAKKKFCVRPRITFQNLILSFSYEMVIFCKTHSSIVLLGIM